MYSTYNMSITRVLVCLHQRFQDSCLIYIRYFYVLFTYSFIEATHKNLNMARSSEIYRLSQRTNQMKTKYKFPILNSQELVMLYDTMGFDINEAVLKKPTISFMKTLIEQIMDKFLYISPYTLKEKVAHVDVDNNNDVNSENDNNNFGNGVENNVNNIEYDLNSPLSIVASQRIMYKFLCDCGINDFSIRDVLKPESTRLSIILSALINYARFREERMGDLDELMDKNDKTLESYKELIQSNHELEDRIDRIKIDLKNQTFTFDELSKNNQELEDQLRSLELKQKTLTDERTKYRDEKAKLIIELENQSALCVDVEKQLEEIRPYIKESPESIKELIQRMTGSKTKETKILENLEQQLRNINVSIDSFQFLIQESNNLIEILEEMKTEADRNKSYDDTLKTLKNQIIETTEQSNGYKRKIGQTERQIEYSQERISKLQTLYTKKMETLEEKLTAHISEFSKFKTQKNLDDVELGEKEAQINDWNNKISMFRKQFDSECKEASFEFEKFNSKVSLYINELKNKINDSKDMLSM